MQEHSNFKHGLLPANTGAKSKFEKYGRQQKPVILGSLSRYLIYTLHAPVIYNHSNLSLLQWMKEILHDLVHPISHGVSGGA